MNRLLHFPFPLRRIALSLTLLLGACSSKNLASYSLLGDLRVLSIQASAPETTAGSTVTLTPLISDLNGAGRTLTYSVDTCSEIAALSSGRADCDDASDRSVVVSSATVTGLSSPNYTDVGPSFSVTVPSTFLALSSAVSSANGVSFLITYKLTASDGTSLTSVKRILVSTKSSPHTNPVLSSILSDGGTLSALPSAAVSLSANISSGSAETYTVTQTDGSTTTDTEELITTWFVSDGSIEDPRTLGSVGTSWTPPTEASSTHGTIVIAVTRDGRGGEAYVKLVL